MKNRENSFNPFRQEFGDHPVFDDEELFQKMWKGPIIVGYMDEVFVPIREEFLVLFKHWYQTAREEEYFLREVNSSSGRLRRDRAYRRLGLIEKFLTKKEVDAIIKQLCEGLPWLQKMEASRERQSHE